MRPAEAAPVPYSWSSRVVFGGRTRCSNEHHPFRCEATSEESPTARTLPFAGWLANDDNRSRQPGDGTFLANTERRCEFTSLTFDNGSLGGQRS